MILYRGRLPVKGGLTREAFATLAGEYAGLERPWDGSNGREEEFFTGSSSSRAISFRLFRSGINEECTLEDGVVTISLFSKEIPSDIPDTFLKRLVPCSQRDATGWKISGSPILLGPSDAGQAALLQDGTERPAIPAIYVTRSFTSFKPLVDTKRLAEDAAGLFMVFEETDTGMSNLVRRQVKDWKPPYNGTIDIYWPEGGWSRLNASNLDPYRSEGYIRSRLMRMASLHRYAPLATSQPEIMLEGLVEEVRSGREENSQLSTLVETLRTRFATASRAMQAEYEEYTSGIEDALKDMELRAVTAEEENRRLKAVLESSGRRPGAISLDFPEDEFYPGEAEDIVLRALKRTADSAGDQNITERRSHQVLLSILGCNRETGNAARKMKEMENAILGTGKTVKADEKTMARLGFVKSPEKQGTHVKYLYHGDPRYTFVLSSTPSDVRTARNKLAEMIQRLYR